MSHTPLQAQRVSSYFSKSETATKDPQAPPLDTSIHGQSGKWQIRNFPILVRCLPSVVIYIFDRPVHAQPISTRFIEAAERLGIPRKQLVVSLIEDTRIANLRSRDFSTSEGTVGAAPFLTFINPKGERMRSICSTRLHVR